MRGTRHLRAAASRDLMSGLVCGLTFCLALALANPTRAEADSRKVVVELFTSQGCSSCPPADANLAALAQRGDIIAISYHVDYWDYLGWRDTFAQAAFSERQRSYSRANSSWRVYTPQVVVGGAYQTVGSDVAAVDALVKAAQNTSRPSPSLRFQKQPHAMEVHATGVDGYQGTGATVWLATVSPKASAKIERGENEGREIEYANVVRTLVPIGRWTGQSLTLTFAIDPVLEAAGDVCLIFLQDNDSGHILTAEWIVTARD